VIYLLDANTLINADNKYYPLERVPEFWAWLLDQGEKGQIKIPIEIAEEITIGSGAVAKWLRDKDNAKKLILSEEVDVATIQKITEEGYGPDVTDIELIEIGRDPFLISAALKDISNRTVVTEESSKPTSKRQNRRVPDVCNQFNIKWCDSFSLIQVLNFSTSWHK
jgi:Domain of unknown function (DUF4411)